MGFFSKIWKGVKKGFKKLFTPIKSVFKTIGKFMNKIGIVGQIAMMFIPIPGLGALMSSMGSALGGAATALGASGNIIAQGAGKLLSGALKVGTKIGQGFKTITEGVKTFVGNTGKYLANKIPGVNIAGAPKSFFGPGSESVLGRTSASISKNMDTLFGRQVLPASTPLNNVKAPTADLKTIEAPAQTGALDEATGKVDFGKQEFGVGTESVGTGMPDARNALSPNSSYQNNMQAQFDASLQPEVPYRSGSLTTQVPDMAGQGVTAAPKQSILGRVGDAIKGAPGKFGDYVTNTGEGGLLDDGYKKAAALPGQIVDQGIRGLIAGRPDAPEQYSQGYAPIQTDSYASAQLAGGMRSLDVYSQFGGFTDYMTPIMGTGASDKGLWAMNLQQRTG